MQDQGGLIKNGFQNAGITDALSMEYLKHITHLTKMTCHHMLIKIGHI